MTDEQKVYCPDCGQEAKVTSERFDHKRIACRNCSSARWFEPAEDLNPFMDRDVLTPEDYKKWGIPTDEEIEQAAQQAAQRIQEGKCRHCDEGAFDGTTVCKKHLVETYNLPQDIVESATSVDDLNEQIADLNERIAAHHAATESSE